MSWIPSPRLPILVLAAFLLFAPSADAQTFESLGTRAAGMGGAFVAVADDASAVYWNPAGLVLGGNYFSLVIDGAWSKAEPDGEPQAGSHASNLIGFSTPPLGLSYYRLSATRVAPAARTLAAAPLVDVERLTSHHAGVTLVQSITSRLAVATTLKLVRGVAASEEVIDGDREDLLDGAGDLTSEASSKFDADVGVMASLGRIRAGLTLRNVTEPDFETPGGGALELKRQTRAGLAYVGAPGLIVAADIDIERVQGSLGEVRNFATGVEARILQRASLRSGFRLNTLSDQPGGHAAVYSVGGSYAAFRSLLVDGQITVGSETGDRGWGIAARLVY
jgi:F plasmid transfer operon, TraF, protein